MTIRELFIKAEKLGFLDEEIGEVKNFLNLFNACELKKGCCGFCASRNTDMCPWPNDSKIAMPICLSYRQKGGV